MPGGKAANAGPEGEDRLALPRLDALPPGFTWGVSTSSFQIEGATREDGRGPSVWDTRCAKGLVANGDTGDIACDHYHRYREDIALMHQLGVGAYRFSVAWPRLLPDGRGTPNEPGLAFYDRLIDALLAAGIEPWLCLYHWDMPQALDELGGWASREVVGWFADYAGLVARRYGDRVTRFATFNEPSIFTLFGPGAAFARSDAAGPDTFHAAIHHVNLAHGAAVDALRDRLPTALVGAIHNVQGCLPSTPADAHAAQRCEAYWNWAFPDPQCRGTYPPLLQAAIAPHMQPDDLARIRRPLDWFGLNHYGPTYIRADGGARLGFNFGDQPQGTPQTPIGWAVRPEGFRDTLLELTRRYRMPIYVMENGLGGHDQPDATGAIIDDARVSYLRDHVGALNAAVAAGADVRGYFVWSLLDNFEWDSGYAVRFGLAYVDYPTQKRTPKASFRWYHDLIATARGRSDHG